MPYKTLLSYMSQFQNNSIFWVEVEKINPNPYQPRREFDEERLKDLAESIRQYGVLQPLTVTRKETIKDDGGILVEYELIAGERRHRASMLAGLTQVPVIIRSGEENSQMKLELAIIENLQREDINAVERARAFARLAEEFEMTHADIGKKVGKSREYVSNSIRLLGLPDDIQNAIMEGKITEGHGRPLLMLKERPDEQITLFREVVFKKLSVRDTEAIARRVARDKVRKKKYKPDPEMIALEKQLSESLGTRVQIEQKEVGGKIVIDFFSSEDVKELMGLFEQVVNSRPQNRHKFMERFLEKKEEIIDEIQDEPQEEETVAGIIEEKNAEAQLKEAEKDAEERVTQEEVEESVQAEEKSFADTVVSAFPGEKKEGVPTTSNESGEAIEDSEKVAEERKTETKKDPVGEEDELYSISNFTV